jgi:hypothetical protein
LSVDFGKEIERNEQLVKTNNYFSIPLLRDLEYISEPKLAPADAIETFVPLLSTLRIGNADKAFCLRIPNELSSLGLAPHYDFYKRKIEGEGFDVTPTATPLKAPIFNEGDIAVIDPSVKELHDLNEELVALSFSIQTKFADVEDRGEQWSTPVLHVGWLRRTSASEGLLEQGAQLKLETELLKKIGIAVREEQSEYFYYLFPSPDAKGRPYASIVTDVANNPKLSSEYKVIGKVIGWMSTENNSPKGKSHGKNK